MAQRGFTLLELTIAAGIMCLMLAAALPLAGALRPAAAPAAGNQFDAAVAYARSLAATSGNGSMLTIQGQTITIYAGRPTAPGALEQSGGPLTISATISESALGPAPLTIFFDALGDAGAMRGAVSPGQVVATDPGCPATETALVLRIADPRVTLTRSLPCKN